jgi:hypothetical protein
MIKLDLLTIKKFRMVVSKGKLTQIPKIAPKLLRFCKFNEQAITFM